MKFYKSMLVGAISICGGLNLAHSSDSYYDITLMNYGAVDANYKFIDIQKAKLFFDNLNEDLQPQLPSDIDGLISIIDINTSPYNNFFIYKMNSTIADKSMMNKIRNSEVMMKYQCGLLFNHKYQKANDTKVSIYLFNDEIENLGSVELNSQTCSF